MVKSLPSSVGDAGDWGLSPGQEGPLEEETAEQLSMYCSALILSVAWSFPTLQTHGL